jgi:hypothetical protein
MIIFALKIWMILNVIALLLIALSKNRREFFTFHRPLWRIHFLELMAILLVTFIFTPLTIPKTMYRLLANR